jgi:hypothetical protein
MRLAVATSPRGLVARRIGGGYSVPDASHPRVSPNARPGRVPMAEHRIFNLPDKYMCDLVSHQSVNVASDRVGKPALPAREVRSTRRVVRGRRRRVRMAGVAQGPEVPKLAKAICKAHPTRRRVIVGAVVLRCVERRCDRRTSAAQTRLSPFPESRRPQDAPAGYHEG